MKIEFSSKRREMLLFLITNLAAVTTRIAAVTTNIAAVKSREKQANQSQFVNKSKGLCTVRELPT